jgi:hypothetical protein
MTDRLYPQRCKVCGRADGFDFTVTDEVWKAVVPEEYQKRVVCLPCFDSLASLRGVNYAHALNSEIYFAGRMASLTLRIKGREDAL